MRGILAILITLAACGGTPGGDDEGPRVGYWEIGSPFDLISGEWECLLVADDSNCSPPAYFTPLPDEVRIGGGGVVDWIGADEHRGTTDDLCIHVPAATEHGVERAAYDFCRLTINDVPSDDHAGVAPIAWNPGTPNECWCSALFVYVGN